MEKNTDKALRSPTYHFKVSHVSEYVSIHIFSEAKHGKSLILGTLTSYEPLYFNHCALQKKIHWLGFKVVKIFEYKLGS